jgi:hypothetical protein
VPDSIRRVKKIIVREPDILFLLIFHLGFCFVSN